MSAIRNSGKAIIIEDDRILLTCNKNENGIFYLLPGGGQRHGESLTEALVRECLEEIGVQVLVGDLLLVRDYISAHHEFASEDADAHQVEFMFRCRIAEGEAHVGRIPDEWQTGVEWVPVSKLDDLSLYPAAIKESLQRIARGERPEACYLGDIN